MEKEFIPYEQALALKELGFDKPCFGYWKMSDWLIQEKTRTDGYIHADQLCSAPLYSQAFRFFRDKYPSLHFGCGKIYDGNKWTDQLHYQFHINLSWEYFEGNYEEAELACLIKLIELAKSGSLKA